jgi:phosphatidate cytidylyltransferase
MAYHLFQYERGSQRAGTDFAVTLSGILYIGWLGAYLISLRRLPDGLWWLLTVLPAVWLADTGAYLVGSRFGRHKMTPRLSPKKSWEGYLGGILFSVPGTA